MDFMTGVLLGLLIGGLLGWVHFKAIIADLRRIIRNQSQAIAGQRDTIGTLTGRR
jgi:hypothetical protein